MDEEWGRCRVCGGEIWEGELVGLDGEGRPTCTDCVLDEWRGMLTWEKLELLGYEVIEARRETRKRRWF